MQKVLILGSTGSIGTQTLEVIDKLNNFEVFALACGKNIELLKKQIAKYNPSFVCVQEENDAKTIKTDFPKLNVLSGNNGLIELAKCENYDILVAATSGIVGVRAVLEAIKNKKKLH